MTTSSTTLDPSAAALPPEASPRLPLPLRLAVNFAYKQGRLTPADLPAEPARGPDLPAWWADVHRFLNQRGVLGAYRASVVADARPAACPSWCPGEHPPIVDRLFGLSHEMTVTTVEVPPTSPGTRGGRTLTFSVVAHEDETGELEEPRIAVAGGLPADFDAATAGAVAQALTEATSTLEWVNR